MQNLQRLAVLHSSAMTLDCDYPPLQGSWMSQPDLHHRQVQLCTGRCNGARHGPWMADQTGRGFRNMWSGSAMST